MQLRENYILNDRLKEGVDRATNLVVQVAFTKSETGDREKEVTVTVNTEGFSQGPKGS